MSKKIPEDYFSKFEDRLQNKIQLMEDDLHVHAPLLAGVDKKNIYQVPDFYFSELDNKLYKKSSRVKTISIGLKRMSIAASLAVLMAVSYNMLTKTNNNTFDGLAEQEMYDYYITTTDDLGLLESEDLLSDLEPVSMFDDIETGELTTYLSSVIDELELEALAEDEIF